MGKEEAIPQLPPAVLLSLTVHSQHVYSLLPIDQWTRLDFSFPLGRLGRGMGHREELVFIAVPCGSLPSLHPLLQPHCPLASSCSHRHRQAVANLCSGAAEPHPGPTVLLSWPHLLALQLNESWLLRLTSPRKLGRSAVLCG